MSRGARAPAQTEHDLPRSSGNEAEGQGGVGEGGERGEIIWLYASAALVGFALIARVHNAFAYPALQDFDGPGHALNVLALYQGRLPDLHSWLGFHPPLYHALGALVWHGLPGFIPVHAALRMLSAAAGVAAVVVCWRTSIRFVARADAAIVASLALCVPVVAIATSMLGNETTCALFASAVLARLTALPGEPELAPRHALLTGFLGGLAALSKSTGVVAVAVATLCYALRYRENRRSAVLSALAVSCVAFGMVAPHYARLMVASGGSPLAIVSGSALSAELAAEMRSLPPGERQLRDYVTIPAATLLAPDHRAPGLERSVPGLLYASLWADGQGRFLANDEPSVLSAAALLAILGLLPTGLALRGASHILRSPAQRGPLAGPLLCAALLLVSLFVYCWIFPSYAAVKASYLLPALLPACLALAIGLSRSGVRVRLFLRAALLAISAGAALLSWWGWWQ